MRKTILLGLLLSLACTPALAETYRVADSDGAGAALLLDMDSVAALPDGTIKVWEVAIPQTDRRDAFAFAKVLLNVDCSKRQTRRLSVATYRPTGELIRSAEVMTDWKGVEPDTLVNSVVNLACERSPTDSQVVVGSFADVARSYATLGL